MTPSKHPPLTTRDAAEYLGCSESYLRQVRMRGSRKPSPAYFKNGRAVRYTVEALDEYLRSNTVRPDRAA